MISLFRNVFLTSIYHLLMHGITLEKSILIHYRSQRTYFTTRTLAMSLVGNSGIS